MFAFSFTDILSGLVRNIKPKIIAIFSLFISVDSNYMYRHKISIGSRGGGGTRVRPHGKSHVAIVFFNTGTDPLRRILGSIGSSFSRGRSVRLSVKYVDETKKEEKNVVRIP